MLNSVKNSSVLVCVLLLPLIAGDVMINPKNAYATKQEDQKNAQEEPRNTGEGLREIERQRKFARQLHTARGPMRLRTNIIASTGLAVGGAVGEVFTTIFSCLLDCIPGVKTNYKPGDFFRQAVDGQRVLWGLQRLKSNRTKPTATSAPKPVKAKSVTRKYGHEAEWVRHKYGFDYFPSRFGGIRVGVGDKTIHVKYGNSIKVGNRTLTASIDPTGRSYFSE